MSGSPAERSRLAATRERNALPSNVSTGRPAMRASAAVVCGVVRVSVQKQVILTVTREVVFDPRQPLCKRQARCVYAMRQRVQAQLAPGFFVAGGQPQRFARTG